MALIKNKKGFFFTGIVILILTLFLVSYTFFDAIDQRKTTQKRISTINNFISSLKQDLQRQIFITGFRTIFLLENKIIETGNYITNLNSTFNENFFNGTIYGESQPLMIGATFQDIQNEILQRANKVNANISFINPKITLTQEDPWNIKIILETNVTVTDTGNVATWNINLTSETLIPVDRFEDPIYVINTNGLVTNQITKFPFSSFVTGSNITNLLNHYENSTYIANSDAPSFLNKLEGINSPNPYGIESLVNLQKLSQQGISTSQKSVVDHIYFSSNSPSSCSVLPTGMPSEFRLDDNHLSTYEVSCAP